MTTPTRATNNTLEAQLRRKAKERPSLEAIVYPADIVDLIDAAHAQGRAEGAAALKPFCWHTDGCACLKATPGGIKRLACDCGLDAAVDAAKERGE